MKRRRRSARLLPALIAIVATGLVAAQTVRPSADSATAAKPEPRPRSGFATGLTAQDYTFMRDAAEAGLTQTQLAKLAAQRASSTDLKEFGYRSQPSVY